MPARVEVALHRGLAERGCETRDVAIVHWLIERFGGDHIRVHRNAGDGVCAVGIT